MASSGRRALLVCALLLAALGGVAAGPDPPGGGSGCASPSEVVVVAGADGTSVASAALPHDRRFALTYRHSVYGVEASEWFVATCDGRLRLAEVRSTSEAVLDYYALEGTRSRTDAGWRLQPSTSVAFDELPLVATPVGRRSLEVDGERLPLWRDDGEPRRLRLRVVSSAG